MGKIGFKRAYRECRQCLTSVHPADEALGIESRYSVGARRLAVLAGTSWSFDNASKHLEEFCGLKISDNTIRDLGFRRKMMSKNSSRERSAAE